MEKRFTICLCQDTLIYNLHACFNKDEIIGCLKISSELLSLFSVPCQSLQDVGELFLVLVSEHITHSILERLQKVDNVI